MARNILFLCHRLPYPPNKGDKIRSYALLRHLASLGTVSLGCFIDDPDDLKHLDAVRSIARGSCQFETLGPVAKLWRMAAALATGKAITTACFGSRRLQRWVDRLFRESEFDDVVIFSSAMAPYLFHRAFPPRRVLFDMVDVDSDKWKQYADTSAGLRKWIYRREARTLERLECEAARIFGRTLLVSEFEAETFRAIAPASASKISSLTNGVDFDSFSPGTFENPFSADETAIVMTGRMDYRPNYEGALWFIGEILPHILKSLPKARIYFVGAAPPRVLREAAGDHVVVTDSVADVRPYLQFAGAVVAPLRIARGVQNKVLEAMAMAKPVVATVEATRSLAVEAGKHLWIENDPRRFADAVLAALRHPGREHIEQTGRTYVMQHHNWSTILKDFDRQLEALKAPPALFPASLTQDERSPLNASLESLKQGS